MLRRQNTSKAIAALLYLSAIAIFAIHVIPQFIDKPGTFGVPYRKFLNCFASRYGLAAILGLFALCSFAAWYAAKKALSAMTLLSVLVFFAALGVMGVWVGSTLFQTGGFYHHDYLGVMGVNMLMSFVPTAAIVILLLRPRRLVSSMGLVQPLCLAVAFMLSNYLLGFLAYVRFQSYLLE